jgi:hypothetical protein
MSSVVVDTDVVSFVFKNHPIGRQYDADLADRTLIVSFMTLAAGRSSRNGARPAGPGCVCTWNPSSLQERRGRDPGIRAFNPVSACLCGDGHLSPPRAEGAIVRHGN